MKYRKPQKITQRTSSVTNSFVQAVIPWANPLPEQKAEALSVLGMSVGNIVCAYCGGVASDWDHLRPLVKHKRPTGYVSDYKNLVPACGRCNQSKGASEWRVWITGSAAGSPAVRGVEDLNLRIEALERFEQWGNVSPIDIESLAPPALWQAHWENLARLEADIRRSQENAAELQASVQRNYEANNKVR